MIGRSDPYLLMERRSSTMKSLSSSSSQTFTRLHARITQEDGAFTVSVRMLNHLKHDEGAWGEEIAASIDMASSMIDSIAKQYCISPSGISVSIVMAHFKDGTFH
jgi:hypothetical protein